MSDDSMILEQDLMKKKLDLGVFMEVVWNLMKK